MSKRLMRMTMSSCFLLLHLDPAKADTAITYDDVKASGKTNRGTVKIAGGKMVSFLAPGQKAVFDSAKESLVHTSFRDGKVPIRTVNYDESVTGAIRSTQTVTSVLSEAVDPADFAHPPATAHRG